jgi:hypothetical protein
MIRTCGVRPPWAWTSESASHLGWIRSEDETPRHDERPVRYSSRLLPAIGRPANRSDRLWGTEGRVGPLEDQGRTPTVGKRPETRSDPDGPVRPRRSGPTPTVYDGTLIQVCLHR